MSAQDHSSEYAIAPVPEAKTVSGWQVGCVVIGIAITLTGLYSGGEIAQTLGFKRAVLALLTASAVLAVMSIPSAIIGQQTRRTSYSLIRSVFGDVGGPFINCVFAIILLGWYAVTAELFGRTLMIGFDEILGIALPQWIFTVLSSLLVLVTTLYGFKAIDRLALVAVPLLIVTIGYVSLKAFLGDLPALESIVPIEGKSFRWAVDAVIGTMIVNVVLMPDLTRYARARKDAVIAAILGNGGGSVISMALAMLPAAVTGAIDPMAYMLAAGLGIAALAILIGATWTTNAINLYSTGLVVGEVTQKESYRLFVAVCGVFGTGLALVGIADNLIDFLLILGIIVPPIAGVYLVDYFVVSSQRPRPKLACLTAFLTAGVGLLQYTQMIPGSISTGLAALDALLLSAALYYLFCWAEERKAVAA